MLIVNLGSVDRHGGQGRTQIDGGMVTSSFCCSQMLINFGNTVRVDDESNLIIKTQSNLEDEYSGVRNCPWCGEKIHYYDHLGIGNDFWDTVLDEMRNNLEELNIYKHYKDEDD